MRGRIRFFELATCVLNYGFWNGLLLFIRLKLKQTQSLKITDALYPISLRPGNSDALVFKQIFLLKEYDLKKDFGMPLPKDFDVIIDAGANIGLASVFFANQYPNSKIISIEPESNNFAQLKINTEPYKNIILQQGALWYKKERLNLANPGYGDWGFMVEKKNEENNGSVQAFSVVDLMEQFHLSKIDLLKIDVEGAEKEIFETGVSEWLPKTKMILVELHDRMKPGCSKAFFKALERENFAVLVSGENLLCVRQ